MLLIPYRVKNPVKRAPLTTGIIILANVMLYVMTSVNGLHIRDSVYQNFAFALGSTPLWKFFIAIFLHRDLLHLGLDMLFLLVMGPAVEDRLGTVKFLIVYFMAGMIAAIFQASMDVVYVGTSLWVGSTACVMGVVGAYWYVYSWSRINVFYWFMFWSGVYEVDAFWVVGTYIVLDLAEGIVSHQMGFRGGIANVAHVAGGAAAVLFCIILHVKRDSEALSGAKAMRADEVDLSNLPVHALETMLDEDPKDVEILRAMVVPTMRDGRMATLTEAFIKVGTYAIDKDPRLVAHFLLDLRGDAHTYKASHLLRLAGLLETRGEAHRATLIYRLIVDRFSEDVDAETALYRLAVCSWERLKDSSAAHTYIDELEWRFPHGQMIPYARVFVKKLPPDESPLIGQ